MKAWAILGFILVGDMAHAGVPSCTGITDISTGANYYADSSDCTISIDKAYYEYTRVWLPDNPYIGDKFTVKDNTDPAYDQCEVQGETTYCWSAGLGVMSINAETTIDGSGELVFGGFYALPNPPVRQTVRFIFNGELWVSDYPY